MKYVLVNSANEIEDTIDSVTPGGAEHYFMKRKIAILGSTGSIGKSTLEVIKKDKKNFEIVLFKEIIFPLSTDNELTIGSLSFKVIIFPLIRLKDCIDKFNVLCININ